MPADPALPAAFLTIEVVYCPQPGVTDQVSLCLPPGATLADALRASGVLERHALPVAELRTGIWSQPRPPGTALRDRDRVEIYRQLRVDPKEARRLRYQRHRETQAKAKARA